MGKASAGDTPRRPGPEPDDPDLIPKQAGAAVVARCLDGLHPDMADTTAVEDLEECLRSDRVFAGYWTVMTQRGYPVYEHRTRFSRAIGKQVGCVSRVERTGRASEDRYTFWDGLGWLNHATPEVAQALLDVSDVDRIKALVGDLYWAVPDFEGLPAWEDVS